MTDPLSADTAEVHATGANLADVSSRMKDVFTALNANLNAAGSAWGDDSIGTEFANGANGYLAQSGDVNAGIAAKTELLDHYSDAFKGFATEVDESG
jgi:hypothetical protein